MKSYLTLIFCSLYLSIFAQITESPLSDNPILRQDHKKTENSHRTLTLSLPFFDDFSNEGPFPDPEKWENRSVFINNTFGHEPPSIGVATFDGLNAHGKRHSENYGSSDTLTSRAIDLTSNPSNLKLSFYLQAKGIGDKPEFKDSIVIQFLTQDENWVTQSVYTGWSGHYDSIPDFNRYEISISSQYVHQSFQFRFINWSGNYGILDVWHLDYVHLSNNEIVDIAFTELPNEILKEYSSMPLKHFANDIDKYLNDSIHIHIRNLHPEVAKADPSNLKIISSRSGSDPLVDETLLELFPIVDSNQRDLNPGIHYFRNRIQQFNEYRMAMESLPYESMDALDLITSFSIQEGSEVTVNDTCHKTTILSNYFAYDDGTAESALSVNVGETGNPTLVNAFYAEIEDTLSAVQFMFPRTNNIADNQLFTIKIWTGTLDEEADFEVKNLKPLYIDNAQDTFQAFTTYRLFGDLSGEDTFIIIPQGEFFVGLYQITGGTEGIPIGFDKNTPNASSNIWFHNGQEWSNIGNQRSGALMIRPMFGFDIPPTTVSATDNTEKNSVAVNVFPNPFSNTLNIASYSRWHKGKIELYTSAGKRILLEEITDSSINTIELDPGVYIVKLTDKTGKLFGSSLIIKQ